MPHILNGQVALVTGAGRGFGRAIALRLAQEGAAVAVVARSRHQLDSVVSEISTMGAQAVAAAADVTRPEEIANAVATTEAAFGPIDLLISNAGVPGPFGPLWAVDPDRWWAAQSVHIRAPLLLLSRILPGMVTRQRGRIILVSALAARMAAPYMSAYCVGKIAQARLAEEIAVETRDKGIAAFSIHPGFVVTDFAEETMRDPDVQKWMPAMIDRLNERAADPASLKDLERCAQRCVDLASGRYDRLSGRYMELEDDLDAFLHGARPHWQIDGPPLQPTPGGVPRTR